MGLIKDWSISSHAANPKELEVLKESIRMLKLKKVNELRTERLQQSLISLVDLYHDLRKKGIPVPYDLTEKIEYIESALGIKFHQKAQEEEIEKHDIDSAERLIEEVTSQIVMLKSKRPKAA
jgi:hypothetical protein